MHMVNCRKTGQTRLWKSTEFLWTRGNSRLVRQELHLLRNKYMLRIMCPWTRSYIVMDRLEWVRHQNFTCFGVRESIAVKPEWSDRSTKQSAISIPRFQACHFYALSSIDTSERLAPVYIIAQRQQYDKRRLLEDSLFNFKSLRRYSATDGQ